MREDELRIVVLYNSLTDKELYKLDFTLEILPKNQILDKINLIGSGYLYKLLSNYLNLPIIDDFGMNVKESNIPTVCEITRILFDIVLIDLFDREKKVSRYAF